MIRKIKAISERSRDIDLYNEDALELVDRVKAEYDSKNTILYFDPPYYLKADLLYLNHYELNDHKEVSKRIKSIKYFRWIVSYDNVDEITELYKKFPRKEYSFNHSAFNARTGKEILFFSHKSLVPDLVDRNPVFFRFKRKGLESKFYYRPSRKKTVRKSN